MLSIGDTYQGGKLAYILQSGDPDFVPGEIHGIIAADSNQVNAIWGCSGQLIGTFNDIGTGQANTWAITLWMRYK